MILETESKMNPTYDISTLIYIHDHKKKTKNYCIDYKHVSKIIYRIETGRYKASNAIQALTKIVFPIGATKNGTRKKHAFWKIIKKKKERKKIPNKKKRKAQNIHDTRDK